MIVRSSNSKSRKFKLKVFSTVKGEVKRVHKSDLQIKSTSFELPTETQNVFIDLLEQSDTELLLTACIIKYFLKHAACPAVLPRLCVALVPLRDRFNGVDQKAKTQWASHRGIDQKADFWNESDLSIMVLEEHIMQRWIAILEAQESFVGKRPKRSYLEDSDDDDDLDEDCQDNERSDRSEEPEHQDGDPLSI